MQIKDNSLSPLELCATSDGSNVKNHVEQPIEGREKRSMYISRKKNITIIKLENQGLPPPRFPWFFSDGRNVYTAPDVNFHSSFHRVALSAYIIKMPSTFV